MFRTCALLLFSFAIAACSSAPEMPAGQGRGLVAADPSPPSGAQTWARPTWKVGDTFTLLRGGAAKGLFEVVTADDKGYVLATDAGYRMRRDLNLGTLGEWSDKDEPLHLMTPVDVRFDWPLWVGKHWRCECSDRTVGGSSLPLTISYVVEDLDTVKVPAGTFQALRILRTVHLEMDGQKFIDRTNVIWYAPEIGLEVRQIVGDAMVELVERTRK